MTIVTRCRKSILQCDTWKCALRTKLPGKLAIVTTHFNPIGFERMQNNFLRFAEGMSEQGNEFRTLEIVFGDHDFFLPEDDRCMRIRTPDILWQKEAALNILIKSLPPEYDKIAWVDADILFENPHWVQDASVLLEEYPVVQCFSSMQRLNRTNKIAENVCPSFIYGLRRGTYEQRSINKAHPGFAWAARRTLLEKHGLYNAHITGGGDSLMFYGFMGWHNCSYVRDRLNEPMRNHFLRWARRVFPDVRSHVGYVEGEVRHLWHGSLADRQYMERVQLLQKCNFNPFTDIAIGDNGLLHWSSDNIQLHWHVKQYFLSRNEDGPMGSCGNRCGIRKPLGRPSSKTLVKAL